MSLASITRRALGRSLWCATVLMTASTLCMAAEASATPPTAQPVSPTVSIASVGDVMLAETPGKRIRQGHDPFAPLARLLAQADVRVANLECVVASGGTAEAGKPYTFRAHRVCCPCSSGMSMPCPWPTTIPVISGAAPSPRCWGACRRRACPTSAVTTR